MMAWIRVVLISCCLLNALDAFSEVSNDFLGRENGPRMEEVIGLLTTLNDHVIAQQSQNHDLVAEVKSLKDDIETLKASKVSISCTISNNVDLYL